jgi:hypothetical protein
MRLIFLCVFVLFFAGQSFAQDNKVHDSNISGSYEGKIKKGLANGKGVAIGVDKYEGFFKKGKKEKSGVYTYKNGDVYDGQFSNDLMHGEGKFTTADGVLTVGYWRDGKYVGASIDDFKGYVIHSSSNLSIKPKFKLLDPKGSKLVIEVEHKFDKVSGLELIEYSSGVINFISKSKLEVNGPTYPFKGTLVYNVPNKSDNFQVNVRVNFEILQNGLWKVNFKN